MRTKDLTNKPGVIKKVAKFKLKEGDIVRFNNEYGKPQCELKKKSGKLEWKFADGKSTVKTIDDMNDEIKKANPFHLMSIDSKKYGKKLNMFGMTRVHVHIQI